MNSPQQVTIKPQLALQSYLDGLLQEATEELQPLPQAVAERVAVAPAPVVVTAPEAIDEFQAAVLEEQARDAQLKTAAPAFAEPTRLVTMATRESVDAQGGSPIAGLASMRPAKGARADRQAGPGPSILNVPPSIFRTP